MLKQVNSIAARPSFRRSLATALMIVAFAPGALLAEPQALSADEATQEISFFDFLIEMVAQVWQGPTGSADKLEGMVNRSETDSEIETEPPPFAAPQKGETNVVTKSNR